MAQYTRDDHTLTVLCDVVKEFDYSKGHFEDVARGHAENTSSETADLRTWASAQRKGLLGPALPVGSICCALSSRGDGTFHWALVILVDANTAVKVHATNLAGSWKFDKVYQNLAASPTMCVVVKIGQTTTTHTIDRVCELLNASPMEVPSVFKDTEKTFTCRVWVKEACRVMAEAGIIKCPDVISLEQEVWAFANEHDGKTIKGAAFRVHTAKSSC